MMKNCDDDKYGRLVANHAAFSIDLWVNAGADANSYRVWCRAYTDMMHGGPNKFWKWYKDQRTLSDEYKIKWGVPYPHEVFPALQTDEFADFYEVFEF